MNSSTINPAWSMRRQISYDTWLAIQADRQGARIQELQAVIIAQRVQLLSAGAHRDAQLRAEINLLTGEAPHE
jgi:hypothetical protein